MRKLLLIVMLVFALSEPALAHRLDEYLQATIFSIEPGKVTATMRLVPGVAVASRVIASIDTNGDGVLSAAEQHHYAEQVLADLQLAEDGRPLPLHLTVATLPPVEQMRAGTGEIELGFAAQLPAAAGHHVLTFANHHQSALSVYLVNSLVSQNSAVQLGAQTRNRPQSFYSMEFAETGAGSAAGHRFGWSGMGAAFRMGARHIQEGTDHLLFLITLLLPAPLLASAGRWRERATVRHSLLRMLGIVTAFTVGHSLTLALAGFGLVQLPSRPVEVLIALSILVSAVHAMRPLFPGREAVIAGSFGLVHGLAFASALHELGVTGWYRLVTLLGFNLGIEAMQLGVVAVVLPALLVLSRSRLYAGFRIAGARVAVVASVAWIVERTTDMPNAIADGIERAAQHGVLLAACLWGCSVLGWFISRRGEALALPNGTPVGAREHP